MHNEDLHKFLEGELNFKNLQETVEENSVEKDFVDSYKRIIELSKEETPDLNPFAKIEQKKKKPIFIVRKILPYAALIILTVGLFFTLNNQVTKQNKLHLTEFELQKLQQNTEMALLHFSKKINTNIAQIKESQNKMLPITDLQSLKYFEIEFENPLINLKFN